MSTKIFTNLLRKNVIYPHRCHLCSPQRLMGKTDIYTRNGDSGKSKIYYGEVEKDHPILEALGVTEELCACIGLAREFIKDDEKLTPLEEKLLKIQLVLVDVMEIVSNLQPNNSSDKSEPPRTVSNAKVTRRDVTDLETLISHYETLLPPVEKTVIPSGGKASAALHVAKAVCRRCERILVTSFKNKDQEKEILAFINRLSTYLFQAARISAKFANKGELVYKPGLKKGGTISDK